MIIHIWNWLTIKDWHANNFKMCTEISNVFTVPYVKIYSTLNSLILLYYNLRYKRRTTSILKQFCISIYICFILPPSNFLLKKETCKMKWCEKKESWRIIMYSSINKMFGKSKSDGWNVILCRVLKHRRVKYNKLIF